MAHVNTERKVTSDGNGLVDETGGVASASVVQRLHTDLRNARCPDFVWDGRSAVPWRKVVQWLYCEYVWLAVVGVVGVVEHLPGLAACLHDLPAVVTQVRRLGLGDTQSNDCVRLGRDVGARYGTNCALAYAMHWLTVGACRVLPTLVS